MRFPFLLSLLLAACGPAAPTGNLVNPDADREPAGSGEAAPATTPLRPATPAPEKAVGSWTMLSSGEGVGLAYREIGGDRPTIHLFCPAARGQLLVNLPTIAPISSEERLSFGGAGDVEALVADTGGDALRGGVSGVGAAPSAARLAAMLVAGPGASYGATAVGPLPPVNAPDATAFAAACNDLRG